MPRHSRDAPASSRPYRPLLPTGTLFYLAGAQLLDSGAVDGVLLASYGGCFVDEYQDCTLQQHQVISRLANLLPTCVFGDPLQAIFDFRDQQPVDWDTDVFPTFVKSAELSMPWRWRNANNRELAEWLSDIRTALEQNNPIDLSSRPQCVTWTALPADPTRHQATIVGQCLDAMSENDLGNLIVIGDSTSENRRSALAQKLAKQGFANIEPIGCKTLHSAATAIDKADGVARLKALLGFVSKCMTGADKTAFERAIDARQQGRRLGQAQFGSLFLVTDAVIADGGELAMLAFLQGMRDRPGCLSIPARDVLRHAIGLADQSSQPASRPQRGCLGGPKQNTSCRPAPGRPEYRQHASRQRS